MALLSRMQDMLGAGRVRYDTPRLQAAHTASTGIQPAMHGVSRVSMVRVRIGSNNVLMQFKRDKSQVPVVCV